MTVENPTWWDREIDDHKAYGGSTNWDSKVFTAFLTRNDESVLDVGCGNGLVYKAMKELNMVPKTYKGIDASFKMIEAARELYPEATWEVGNTRKIEEADKSYDHVLLIHVIEAMRDYEEAIKECMRVAKNKVTVAFWRGLSHHDHDIPIQMGPGLDDYGTSYSAKKFFTFLKDQGFIHSPWVEFYADDTRYNLFITVDLQRSRTEVSAL